MNFSSIASGTHSYDNIPYLSCPQARGDTFKFDPLLAPELRDAAITLGVAGLEDMCNKGERCALMCFAMLCCAVLCGVRGGGNGVRMKKKEFFFHFYLICRIVSF
jgi:hypothetical protein